MVVPVGAETLYRLARARRWPTRRLTVVYPFDA
jgi:hypothetical protein